MPDVPKPEGLQHVVEDEEKKQGTVGLAAAYIPDVVDGLEVAADLAEPTVEAVVEAGGTLLEGAVEAVGEVIGTVIGGIFDS